MVPRVADSGLRRSTLDWLLEPRNPSARYLTLTRLLGQSADAPHVRASRSAIAGAAPARDVLVAQYPQGYWMHPGIGYSPCYRATIWQILILAQLGMARCDRLDRAVGHLFEENQHSDGAFRASREEGDTPIGLNGSILWAVETLGYGDTPEVEQAWSWLAREVQMSGAGWASVRGSKASWSAVKALWAANAVPPQRRRDPIRIVRTAAAQWLLDRAPDPVAGDSCWFPLTFPLTRAADTLQWMAVLTDAGYGRDPRLSFARTELARRRHADGTWPLERVPGKLWADFGELHKPNKWMTIRVLATLR